MNTTPEGPFEFQAAVWVSDLSQQERVIALAYGSSYNWKNQDDSKCGIYRIASMTGIGKTQVSTYRKSLVEKGWLSTTRRFGNSSLTRPTIPAGFSYEEAKSKQDELVQSQNQAEKDRRKKASKKDDEIAALKAQLAALQGSQEPVTVVEAPVDPEPVTEPQEASEGFEMTDAEMQEALDLDPFENEPSAPVVEKPARKTRKKVEKVDPVKQMLEQAETRKSLNEKTAAEKLANAENPENAKRLFEDESWKPETTDLIQRASLAALFSDEALETVTVGSSSFDEEW
ncbi:hypothetical protein [Streptomyces sp. NPDC005385]|uniref:hypothetical protein n=1 Tax=Streptomyces sp. NPDC005385 TaxID=3157039 RepID=UPI0033AD3AE8